MPVEQSEGFVLRTFDVGEQDKIVVFFSSDKGVFRGVAKGARKFGNRFGSCLEPLSLIKLFYYEKENKELVTISNCDLLESFFEIQRDLTLVYTLGYFAELIEEFFPSRAKDDLLFRLLHRTLQALQAGGEVNLVGAYFEAWFLKINGLLPNFSVCRKCRNKITSSSWLAPRRDGVFCDHCTPINQDVVSPDMRTFLNWIRKNPPPQDEAISLTQIQITSLRKIYQSIIVFHMEKEPKTLRHLKA